MYGRGAWSHVKFACLSFASTQPEWVHHCVPMCTSNGLTFSHRNQQLLKPL